MTQYQHHFISMNAYLKTLIIKQKKIRLIRTLKWSQPDLVLWVAAIDSIAVPSISAHAKPLLLLMVPECNGFITY